MLGFIPYEEIVILYKAGEVDSWGLCVGKTEPIKKPCYIRESQNTETIYSDDGKIITFKYDVTFEGNADVVVGDFIEVEGFKLKILAKRYLKDFSRNIIATKVSV